MPRIERHANGHCGLIRMLLHTLLCKYEITERRIPSPEEVMAWYHGTDMLKTDMFVRIYNRVLYTELSVSVRDVLRKIIRGVAVRVPPDAVALNADAEGGEVAAVRWLIRNATLVETPVPVEATEAKGPVQGDIVTFASWFHRWYFASVLYPGRNDGASYQYVEQFLLAVLKTFSPDFLLDRGNWGQTMAKEGLLQHMFWTGALASLPASTRVITETSNALNDSQVSASTGMTS